MNEIMKETNKTPIEIALGIDEKGNTTAKRLYEYLEMDKTHYSRWCKTNITENEFAEENVDYFTLAIGGEREKFNPNPTTDYTLTAKFAKKLSMTAKNEKGEQAREYFCRVEDKLKETVKPKSTLELLELHLQVTKELRNCIEEVDNDLQNFKQEMPLLAVDTDRITTAKKSKGTQLLGGKISNAYRDRSMRSKVYRDIECQIRRQFGVRTYKAIKRNQCDSVIQIIKNYELPIVLKEEIEEFNN